MGMITKIILSVRDLQAAANFIASEARRLHAAPEASIWEFPKIRDTLFGSPYNKDLPFRVLY